MSPSMKGGYLKDHLSNPVQMAGGPPISRFMDLGFHSQEKSAEIRRSSSDTTSLEAKSKILAFLGGCSPPLESILSRFMDMGFHSPEKSAAIRRMSETIVQIARGSLTGLLNPKTT